jgi:hypothetical protein
MGICTRDTRRAAQLSRSRSRPVATASVDTTKTNAWTRARRCRAPAAFALLLRTGLAGFQVCSRFGFFGLLLDVWLGTRSRLWSGVVVAAAIVVFVVFESCVPECTLERWWHLHGRWSCRGEGKGDGGGGSILLVVLAVRLAGTSAACGLSDVGGDKVYCACRGDACLEC